MSSAFLKFVGNRQKSKLETNNINKNRYQNETRNFSNIHFLVFRGFRTFLYSFCNFSDIKTGIALKNFRDFRYFFLFFSVPRPAMFFLCFFWAYPPFLNFLPRLRAILPHFSPFSGIFLLLFTVFSVPRPVTFLFWKSQISLLASGAADAYKAAFRASKEISFCSGMDDSNEARRKRRPRRAERNRETVRTTATIIYNEGIKRPTILCPFRRREHL